LLGSLLTFTLVAAEVKGICSTRCFRLLVKILKRKELTIVLPLSSCIRLLVAVEDFRQRHLLGDFRVSLVHTDYSLVVVAIAVVLLLLGKWLIFALEAAKVVFGALVVATIGFLLGGSRVSSLVVGRRSV
jgi:hypothetical protein